MAFPVDDKFYFGEGIDRRIQPNNPKYPEGAMWDMLNCVYVRDASDPEKMRGMSRLGSTDMGGAVSGLFDYDQGTRLIATAVDGKIYERNAGDFSQSTGGTGFDTTSTTRWSGAMYYGATTAANLLILTNGVDAPQKYTSGAGVSALGGSPPSAGQFPVAYLGRLWMAQGSTLFFSVTNDAEDWTSGNGGGSIQVDRGSGDITGLYPFMNDLIIFKRDKIFRLNPVSTIAETALKRISGAIGSLSYWTIQEAASDGVSGLAFLSENGVMLIRPTDRQGGYAVQNVSGQVKALLDSRVRTSTTTNWAIYNQDRAEYSLQYPQSGTTPSSGLIANMARRHVRWTRHDRANLTAGAIHRSSTQDIQVVGDTNGRVYQQHTGDDWAGSPYSGKLLTPSYSAGAPGFMKQYGRVFVDANTNGSYAVTTRIAVGRAGLPTPRTQTDSLENEFGLDDGWGVGLWGEAQWGGSGIAGRWIRLDEVARGYWLSFSMETTGNDQWFRLNGILAETKITARTQAA